jgi:hypothetical protein
MQFTVHAGNHARKHCPVWLDGAGLDPARDYLAVSNETGAALPAQAVATADGVRLVCIVSELDAQASQTFTLEEDQSPAAVSVADGTSGVDINLDGQLFTTYHHAAQHNKLFLYPIIGPTGKGLTRGYPMVSDIPGEKHDHPHHKSIHVAHGDVNGVDLWSELDDHGYQRHDSFSPAFGAGSTYVSGPVCGAFRSRSYWVSRAEQPVVAEEKHVVVYAAGADARIMDITVTLQATEGPVRFGDTKEGAMLSVRVASSMDADGDGHIENGYGARGEDECFGYRAPWMDYTGPVDGATVGLAVFDHPSSFRYPTYWHVRNYGLVHANSFAWREFLGHPGVDGSYVLPEGAVLRCKFRVYLHTGNTQEAGVAARYHDFITPPVEEAEP